MGGDELPSLVRSFRKKHDYHYRLFVVDPTCTWWLNACRIPQKVVGRNYHSSPVYRNRILYEDGPNYGSDQSQDPYLYRSMVDRKAVHFRAWESGPLTPQSISNPCVSPLKEWSRRTTGAHWNLTRDGQTNSVRTYVEGGRTHPA